MTSTEVAVPLSIFWDISYTQFAAKNSGMDMLVSKKKST